MVNNKNEFLEQGFPKCGGRGDLMWVARNFNIFLIDYRCTVKILTKKFLIKIFEKHFFQ